MSDQEERAEDNRMIGLVGCNSGTCIQCGKGFLAYVMEKDYIVNGLTCRACVQKIEDLPEILDYIDRLERNRDTYKRLADAYAKPGGLTAIHEVENRHMKTIREVISGLL
jgi:hypothetical protein